VSAEDHDAGAEFGAVDYLVVNGWLMDGYWMVYLFYNIWLVIWKMAWLL
jgi:hypothetical protein